MKIHLLQFPDFEEMKRFDEPYSPKLDMTQPIDVENIVSISPTTHIIDDGHRVIAFSFTIYLKIGQPIIFIYNIPSEISNENHRHIYKFLDEQREQLIIAWTES
jgi:hypothetical protein